MTHTPVAPLVKAAFDVTDQQITTLRAQLAAALERVAELEAAPVVEWRPISEYVEPKGAIVTTLVLLGWYQRAAGGMPAGMLACGVGWLASSGKWINTCDSEAWHHQPTHFACLCRNLPMAKRDHHPTWTYGQGDETP